MIDISIDPTRGRIFKLIRPLDHKSGITTEYHYITQTMHVGVTQYETPPSPKREKPRWFTIHLSIAMIDQRGGFGNTYEWVLNAYLHSYEETTADDMEDFLNQISKRENERTMGIK